MPSTTHAQNVRRLLGVLAGIFVAFVPVISALSVPAKAGATGEYSNGAIADKALQYVGRWGGNACADSRKPGDSGGQCRSFVNCIVWMVSGGTQNIGGGYFTAFGREGGQEIRSLDLLQKGDIVQEGYGRHTFIIVGRVSGNTFTVVDSNRRWNERVSTYDRQVSLNGAKRAFRMGINTPAPAVVPPKPMLGGLEGAEVVQGGVMTSGWVIDADITRPVYAQVFAGRGGAKPEDGTSVTVKADVTRLDIAAQNQGYGSSHGFRAFIALPKGEHTLCLYGINAPNTPGDNIKLGCKTVDVR